MYGLRLESIAFSLGPIDVHWYGIILGTAALDRAAAGGSGRKTIRIIARLFYGYAFTWRSFGNHRSANLFCRL